MRIALTIGSAILLLVGAVGSTQQSGPIVLDVTCGDTTEIYTVDERGSDLRRLTNLAPQHAWASHPAWSPDGHAIAFTVVWHAGNRHRSEIYIMSPGGGDLRPLTQTAGSRSSWNASWAPDGRHVAFASDRDGNHDVYIMRSDGEGVERLTVTQGNERHSWNPAWSPDGRRIAFDSNRDGDDEIYILDLASRRVHAIGSTPQGKGSWTPAWSPDGRRIAFASNRDGADELYVMNADGSGVRRINVRATGRPRWAPHGKALIFQRFETPQREAVWTVAVDGTALTRLVGDERCSVRHPDWWGR